MSEKKDIKKTEKKEEIKKDENKNFWGKIGDFVKDAVDCCIE